MAGNGRAIVAPVALDGFNPDKISNLGMCGYSEEHVGTALHHAVGVIENLLGLHVGVIGTMVLVLLTQGQSCW